ncbi:hypothetical protein E2562_000321 [Oryza meyeriana var. granulata]|uniref:Uncharacterized protein n=1 Tax=Oryza meyeriana var. granulata TaxID=110450 RepID=A0A6G1CMU4_9ORYZ|nr:hypothetical protein E2562_000321 [Oryza meyeriana var. granulata]
MPKDGDIGRTFEVLEGYAVHAGASREEVANFENTDVPQVSNPCAQEHLEQYRDAMIERDGLDVDWFHGTFDPQMMYDCTGGKPHGRFAMADGAFDSDLVQTTCTAGASSEFGRAGHQRVDTCTYFDVYYVCKGPHNLHAAAIQKTGDSSDGYPQAAHNFGENGSGTSPAGRTSSTENANTAENGYEPTIGRPTATKNVNAVENGYVPTVGGINAEESSSVDDANDPFLAQMLG